MSTSFDDIKYARSGTTNLAYHVMGTGAVDILLMSFVISIESQIEHPQIAQYLEHLASFSRLIRYDRRGVGLSDPISLDEPPTLEVQVQDAVAVLDEVRAQEACVIADNAGHAGILLAAQHPRRVTRLILDHPIASILQMPEDPPGLRRNVVEHEVETAEEEHRTGRPVGFIRSLPSVMNNPETLAWFVRAIRRGASPGTMGAFVRVLLEADVSAVLPNIQTPTLVVCRRDVTERWSDNVAYVADMMPNADLVRVPGADPVFWVGDWRPIADAIRSFVAEGVAAEPEHRQLATVLFTDIVGSTQQAAAFGDKRWRELLGEHDKMVASHLARFGGRQVKSTGDGILATFDGPARAVRCARVIGHQLRGIGLDMRAGIHAGEIEAHGDDVTGIAVNIARRVCDSGGAGELLVSRTVVDLVAGSGLEFDDRGEHELKGVPGRWQLFAVV